LTLPGLELRPLGRPAGSQSLYRLRYPTYFSGAQRIEKRRRFPESPSTLLYNITDVYATLNNRKKSFLILFFTFNLTFNFQPSYSVLHFKTNNQNITEHKYFNEIKIDDYKYGSALGTHRTTSYNSIRNSTFHEKLPDGDPAGSKHVANVHNKTNGNIITLVIYYAFVVLSVVQ
jgi:hypothetical protein